MSYLEMLKARNAVGADPAKPPKPQPVAAHPLTEAERCQLLALADAWGMDEEERAVMFRQCEHGGEAVDGTAISAAEARAFWLGEAGAVH